MFRRAMAGDETRRPRGPMTARRHARHRRRRSIMEMTWMETVELLGLDLLAAMLLAVVVLDVMEQGLHSAWKAVRGPVRGDHQRPSVPTHAATVSFE
jgi:hypothetical protein